MIQRILELDDEVLERYDLSKVRAVPVSGSALPGSISDKWMDHFGENLYNLYGSTEVAWATIATPRDLREAPGTVGRPPRGSVVQIYDDDGKPVPARARAGASSSATTSSSRATRAAGTRTRSTGCCSSGDVGHFDGAGRLFIDGRDDDMIVSGGENVFPAEVEDLLTGHETVADVGGLRRRRREVRPAPEGRDRQEGRSLSEKEVQDYVKKNLAGYKAPRDVVFVDELPRTSTGKVLKRELQDAS